MRVEAAGLAALAAGTAVPFVRHAVGRASYDVAWAHGAAVVVHGPRHTVALGPPDDLAPLLARAAREVVPQRLTVEEGSLGALPPAWAFETVGHWHWMLSTTVPPEPAVRVEAVLDARAVDAVLDVGAPTAHARPGMPDIEGWLGVRDGPGPDAPLVGVGAVRRDPDGSGHLRAVTVLPTHGGRGLGRALSVGLTRQAMDRAPHVATLGVYVDNARAIGLYRSLGYATAHTFRSGQPGASGRSMTTAAAPSR